MAPNCRANPIKKIHALTRLCLSKLAHFEPGEGFCRCGVDPMRITDIVQVSRTWRDVPVFFDAKRRSWPIALLVAELKFGRDRGKSGRS
jgi:hypothetical protein